MKIPICQFLLNFVLFDETGQVQRMYFNAGSHVTRHRLKKIQLYIGGLYTVVLQFSGGVLSFNFKGIILRGNYFGRPMALVKQLLFFFPWRIF